MTIRSICFSFCLLNLKSRLVRVLDDVSIFLLACRICINLWSCLNSSGNFLSLVFILLEEFDYVIIIFLAVTIEVSNFFFTSVVVCVSVFLCNCNVFVVVVCLNYRFFFPSLLIIKDFDYISFTSVLVCFLGKFYTSSVKKIVTRTRTRTTSAT